MHPALTRGNGVRASGGARGSDGNWQTWLTQRASSRCWCREASRFSPSSCLPSGNGKHASPVRRRSGFNSPGRLHADVAQWSERDLAKVEAPGSRPGIRSHTVLVQLARDTSFRATVIGVRVPGTVLMESEPDRGRASLLTTARVTPWCSSHPLSSEDDAARWRSPPGKRAGVKALVFESPVFLHLRPVPTGPGEPWRVNPPGLRAPFRKRVVANRRGIRVLRSPPWKVRRRRGSGL
jgi:hypothetical protein